MTKGCNISKRLLSFNVVMYYILYIPVTLLSFKNYREVHKVFTPVTCEITGINILT